MKKLTLSKDQQLIIKRLKTAREKAGMSQKQAAKFLNKTQSFISKIESGHKDLRVSQLREFSRIYKERIEYFLK